jgi:hypothetical protein
MRRNNFLVYRRCSSGLTKRVTCEGSRPLDVLRKIGDARRNKMLAVFSREMEVPHLVNVLCLFRLVGQT